jgi:flagellar motor switch protein FliN/FliY
MDRFGPEVADQIVAACQAAATEIAAALSRTFDASIAVAVGEPSSWSPGAPPEGFEGPGLVMVFKLGDVGALAMLPEASGLLPNWYASPDSPGRSKLGTLAREFGTLLFPERLLAQTLNWIRADRLTDAAICCEVAAGAALLPLTLTAEPGRVAVLHLIWPAARPEEVLRGSDKTAADSATGAVEATTAEPLAVPADGTTMAELPSYARSLLRIAVPLSVTLASKRQSVQSILQLGSGSIIQFEKSCDEMLDLSVGDQQIAKGEAVKVGDKFGIRITSFVFPEEQFVPLTRDPQHSSQGGRSTVRRAQARG